MPLTSLLPACPIHQLTGLLCPGCGGTRAILALLHADLPAAWAANPLLVALLPFAILYAAALLHHRLRRRPISPPSSALVSALLLAAAVFTVARNL